MVYTHWNGHASLFLCYPTPLLFFLSLILYLSADTYMQTKCFSVLMKSIREDIEKEHHAIQKCDIIVFFKVAEFVTSFQYHKFLISQVRNNLSSKFFLFKRHRLFSQRHPAPHI